MSDEASNAELAFYERFFFERGFEPYPEQETALTHVFAGESVMVSVPTGTGKTLVAFGAISFALAMGKKAVYTTPLRALTEEKYRELCDAFGEEQVGLATGDVQRNRDAPIQVEVAEVLWSRIFDRNDRRGAPDIDVVIMDESHYFNDYDRGYVWEQSLIGLHKNAQVVLLSATVGQPESFCQWLRLVRGRPVHLVASDRRQVALSYSYRWKYMIDAIRHLAANGDVPAVVFVFGRAKCFEAARLLKSCRRFTSDDEKQEIAERIEPVLADGGGGPILKPLLTHGIGVHHAGILPPYRRLVERLTADRLLKVVVSTETIAAGINLPAKTVVFSALSKYIGGEPRLVSPAEFQQMAGRAGRPQYDTEGFVVGLAPQVAVQELRKETKRLGKAKQSVDETKLKKTMASRAVADARKRGDVLWDEDDFNNLRHGDPRALASQSQLNAAQVLTIGWNETLSLSVDDVIDKLLLSAGKKAEARKRVEWIRDNLRALEIDPEDSGASRVIRELQGIDGMFVVWLLSRVDVDYEQAMELVEFLVVHDGVRRILEKKEREIKRTWIKARLREMRQENPQANWDDAEAEYDQSHKRAPSWVEEAFAEFSRVVAHPELHAGKSYKDMWKTMRDEGLGLIEYVDQEGLAREEGTVFTYLMRLSRAATKLHEVSDNSHFAAIADELAETLGTLGGVV